MTLIKHGSGEILEATLEKPDQPVLVKDDEQEKDDE